MKESTANRGRGRLAIRSGLLAGAAALIVLPMSLITLSAVVSQLRIMTPVGFVFVLSTSLIASAEVFRCTFNWLCERCSNEIEPPNIRPWRIRSVLGA